MQEFPDESYYAAVLHEFYREHDNYIAMPCLAMQTEEELNGKEDIRWSSADWFWTEIEFADEELFDLHNDMNELSTSRDAEYWEETNRKWMRLLMRTAKRLTTILGKQSSTTRDFGFYLFDSGELNYEVELIRASTSAAKFKRVFPHLYELVNEQNRSKQQLKKMPRGKKLQLYLSNLSEHDDAVVKMGAAAVPALAEKLDDREAGYLAARCLGRIGIANIEVIQALRAKCETEAKPVHHAIALSHLGGISIQVGEEQTDSLPGSPWNQDTVSSILTTAGLFLSRTATGRQSNAKSNPERHPRRREQSTVSRSELPRNSRRGYG